jgi:hypothetical protein
VLQRYAHARLVNLRLDRFRSDQVLSELLDALAETRPDPRGIRETGVRDLNH